MEKMVERGGRERETERETEERGNKEKERMRGER